MILVPARGAVPDGVPGDDGRPALSDESTAVRRVLVVDDDPAINRLVRARLATRGFALLAAASGEEALDLIAEEPPDLIFLDISMPGVDGLEVLAQVRASGADLAVIMMTAFGSEAVAVEALRRGADDYLRKPFERAEFEAIVDRTIRRLELGRQNAWLRAQLEEQHRKLAAEIARAGRVQAELLPSERPAIAPFELAARCIPAREVGGDFYDWQASDSRSLWLTLADVMGKGMPAALWMATVRTAMRAVVRDNPPGVAMHNIGLALEPDLSRADAFVTLFLACLDHAARRLTYVDAGHGHAFLRRANGLVELLPLRGLPVGILPDQDYQQGEVAFAPGDALVLYSDGLVDARPELTITPAALADELVGAATAEAMVERLVVLGSDGGQLPDDLTIVVLLLPRE